MLACWTAWVLSGARCKGRLYRSGLQGCPSRQSPERLPQMLGNTQHYCSNSAAIYSAAMLGGRGAELALRASAASQQRSAGDARHNSRHQPGTAARMPLPSRRASAARFRSANQVSF